MEIITTYQGEIPEPPQGQKSMWLADVRVDIVKSYRGVKYKDKKTIEMLYTDGAEKNSKSYFIGCLLKEIKLKKKEDYKIISIDRKKYLSFTNYPTP